MYIILILITDNHTQKIRESKYFLYICELNPSLNFFYLFFILFVYIYIIEAEVNKYSNI